MSFATALRMPAAPYEITESVRSCSRNKSSSNPIIFTSSDGIAKEFRAQMRYSDPDRKDLFDFIFSILFREVSNDDDNDLEQTLNTLRPWGTVSHTKEGSEFRAKILDSHSDDNRFDLLIAAFQQRGWAPDFNQKSFYESLDNQ